MTESFRWEGTSGGHQYNLQLKAEATSPTLNISSSGGHTTLPGPALVFYHPYGEKKFPPHSNWNFPSCNSCSSPLSLALRTPLKSLAPFYSSYW